MNAHDLEQILAFAGAHQGGVWLPMDGVEYQAMKILDNTGRWAIVLFTEDETRIAVHAVYPVTNTTADAEIARAAAAPRVAERPFLKLLPPFFSETGSCEP